MSASSDSGSEMLKGRTEVLSAGADWPSEKYKELNFLSIFWGLKKFTSNFLLAKVLGLTPLGEVVGAGNADNRNQQKNQAFES